MKFANCILAVKANSIIKNNLSEENKCIKQNFLRMNNQTRGFIK